MMRWLRTMLRGRSHSRPLSTPAFEIIDKSQIVDEELLAHYKPSQFYPVNLCDVYESRYQVLSKLGYGSCSTVWLSRDITFVIFPSQISELILSTQPTEVCGTESLYLKLSKYRARTCGVCTPSKGA